MDYRIKETKENNMVAYEISVEDFSYLMEDNYETIIKKMVKEDQLLKLIRFPECIINLVIDIIINDKDIDYLKEELTKRDVPLYSLMINLVNIYKRRYKKLLELKQAEQIKIVCNKDNFIKSLELAKKLNNKIVIEGDSISLTDYQKILSDYDIDSLNDFDIKIYYQASNHEISVRELYETSIIIKDISDEIEKYNLSPLEQIIYVYDKVKSRVYTKSDKDERESRDLDRVLQGDYIVCVGFSNIFNAVLRSLGINAMPLISIPKNHQCSLVYIEDTKYNINGVYAFDPTNDSRCDDKYIDNYNYFGLTIKDIENIFPNEIYNIINITFDDIINLQKNISLDGFKKSIDLDIKTEKLFAFIKEQNYENFREIIQNFEFASQEDRNKALDIFQTFIRKYNPKEISPSIFILALYSTRMLEYYNGIVDKFDIDSISEATKERSIGQKFISLKDISGIKKVIKMLSYSSKLDDALANLVSQINPDIERSCLNIRLLKVLRNKQK